MEKEKIVEIISKNQKIKETIQIDDSTSKQQEKKKIKIIQIKTKLMIQLNILIMTMFCIHLMK